MPLRLGHHGYFHLDEDCYFADTAQGRELIFQRFRVIVTGIRKAYGLNRRQEARYGTLS